MRYSIITAIVIVLNDVIRRLHKYRLIIKGHVGPNVHSILRAIVLKLRYYCLPSCLMPKLSGKPVMLYDLYSMPTILTKVLHIVCG